jgi:RimJ/RimL family protein N-acetyltransferase
LSTPVDALCSPGTRFVAREEARAAVVTELGAARVVLAPTAVLAKLESLPDDLLLDVPALLTRLERFHPRSIGTASLAYTDRRPVELSMARHEPADSQMVHAIRTACHGNEWDESGLMAMPHRWAAFTPGGHLAALAGYEPLGSYVAHLGVAAHPAQRGRGYAAVAARAAMTAAWGQDLVAQWRCRVGNEQSVRLADHLGFARLGRQTAVVLQAPSG